MFRYLLSIIFFPFFLIGQNKVIDSLKLELKKTNHDTTIVKIYDDLASLVYRDQPDTAISYWKEAILFTESCKNKYQVLSKENKTIKGYHALYLNNIGFIYYNRGLISIAIEYFDRSLKLQEEINDKEGIAYSLNNIAFIYNNQGEEDKALEYFERSIKIQNEIGKKKGIVTTLNNIGVIYQKRGDMARAMKIFSQSLKLAEEIKFKEGIARSLHNIGNIYESYGDPSVSSSKKESMKLGIKKAVDYYSRSLKIWEEIGDKKGIANSLIVIGNVYLKEKNYQEALAYSLRSMKLSKELGYILEIGKSAEMLDVIYRGTGKYNLSRVNYELFIQMRDSVSNETTRKASIKQQIKHEYEKKAAADSVAYAKVTEIKNAELKVKKNQQYALFWGLGLVMIFALFIYNRFRVTQKQKIIIEHQKGEVEVQKKIVDDKQKEIVDSISYAKRLQDAILPPNEFVNLHIANNFIYYRPKDIVAGDFYWAEKVGEIFFIAAADSTGHGVPGAMVSVVCSNALNRTIKEFKLTETGKILDKTRELVLETFEKSSSDVKDGMDISLLCIDSNNKNIFWSGANNPLWYIHDNELKEIKADKQPIGKSDYPKPFKILHITYLLMDLQINSVVRMVKNLNTRNLKNY